MSHPFRWYTLGILGRKVSLVAALVAGIMFAASTVRAQGQEAVDVVMKAGERLSQTPNDNLLAIITICALGLAGFFGWLEKASLQVIQQKVTSIETALLYSGILKKPENKGE